MPAKKNDDVFADYDDLLAAADTASSPWTQGDYIADLDLFRSLLARGLSGSQQSGRPAKAFDAWIAHEFRRAGFNNDAVWPRARRPRVLPADFAELETAIDELANALEQAEKTTGKLTPATVRSAIRAVTTHRLGDNDAYILGDFYAKQVDVVISSWRRGPELLVSTKTQFSSYRNNFNNRHEEAVGEVDTLRRRHPMAAMGFAYLVRDTVHDKDGDYALLQNILTRLRRPSEAFDATMLLVADWDDADPLNTIGPIAEPDPELGAGRFFTDLIAATVERTPVGEHRDVRKRRDGEPKGGLPDEGAGEVDDQDDLDDLVLDAS